ncbi:hypothetical protein F511_47651 [Dorcoceras hygrometricum]|uniref:Uncharacterized protein n=1 Tax=Dorcoceras hygrometricum TaxID=472368 RepID=A0A2Z6ZQJ1_9LAMI|nr:hypothetical protein F511_47651 [Dorcoceras hygrometricum]
MLHGGRPDMRHGWRTVLRGSAALRAAACGHAPHAMLAAAAAAVRPPSNVSPAALRRLISSRYCSGLSRAAHEVFGANIRYWANFGRF